MDHYWEIYVPKAFNDGEEILDKHHHRWDDFVYTLAGGHTIFKKAQGSWRSPEGKLFREEMIPVRIKCDEATINMIADFTLQHYDQLAVFFYLVSTKAVIKYRQP